MTQFSTAGFRQGDGLDYWLDYVCKTYVPVEISNDGARFDASAAGLDLGNTRLTQVTSSPVEYARTRRTIRQSDGGEYLLTLLTEGALEIEQGGRSARIGAGDLCLFDTAQTYRLRFSTAYEAIHLKIARQEFDQRLPMAETISAMRVAAEGRYARLAATMLRSTMELVSDAPPRQLAATLLDLVALAFDESFGELTRDNSRYARIVARAQEVISDRLFDTAFDLSSVPREIGVSARTMGRAFAQLEMTPSKWMWSKRLDAARGMIRNNPGLSVSEVAMTCGFNDFSHFSRAFKARFGATPSSMMT